MTPALAAGVTEHLWKIDDLVAPVDEHDAKPRVRSRGGSRRALGAE
jgi:hypothetical protein